MNNVRSQAMIAAYEACFRTELQVEPLLVDLRDNLGHFDEKARRRCASSTSVCIDFLRWKSMKRRIRRGCRMLDAGQARAG